MALSCPYMNIAPEPARPASAYLDEEPRENPLACMFTCVTDCCIPACTCCLCPCCCFQGGLSYRLKNAFLRSLKIKGCHKIQSWLIRHPFCEKSCCCCIRPCITVHDLKAYGSSMIHGFNKEVGAAWCDNMKVEIADPAVMQEMMTSPQDGGPSLGQAWLAPHMLPTRIGGESLFLPNLASGLGDAASEQRSTIRALLWKYLLNDEAVARQSRDDPVISRLLLELRAAVK
ncbi:unnamed protein product, partial [Polarella glacialis]